MQRILVKIQTGIVKIQTTLRNCDAANTLILKILEILLEKMPTTFLKKNRRGFKPRLLGV